MAEQRYILVDRPEGYKGVVVITLNRPEVLNALNFLLLNELVQTLQELEQDPEIGCVVITGAGEKAFAAGADIKEMADKTPVEMMNDGIKAWEQLRRIRVPLIAAVNGYALGGGCELVLHCDMIIASENARFGQPEIAIGVIPGAGATQRLTRVLGKYRTMEMVLTGAQVSAQELAHLGLVNRVVPKGEHLQEALKLAQIVAQQPRIAARLAKETIQAALETSLEEGLTLEQKNFLLLFSTEDKQEGMRAFIEKRKAQFKGH